MKAAALLIGLNYAYSPKNKLNGAITDVHNMAAFLRSDIGISSIDVRTDDTDRRGTSSQGIVRALYELAARSYKDELDFVWIHYSGHGTYVRDTNCDDKDGRDECLVPSDFETAGLVADDTILSVFRHFNPRTRIVFVCDSCHSGTIGDLRFSWEGSDVAPVCENASCDIQAPIISFSGCMDKETSADAYNVLGDRQYVGAMTAYMLQTFASVPSARTDIFQLLSEVRIRLKAGGFPQTPKLCSSHDLAKDPSIFLS